MKPLTMKTLIGMRDQLGGHAWRDAELEELVNPRLGVISGMQSLLEQLDELRRIDLEAVPPAAGLERR